MFTGIIDQIGRIESVNRQGDTRIVIACDYVDFRIGESIACNGACMTVVEFGKLPSGESFFALDISDESLRRTVPGQWEKGSKVNLERSLRLGDTLDGGLVTGHVDGVARILSITLENGSHRLEVEAPAELARFIAGKGTVVLDGVALTVNEILPSSSAAHSAGGDLLQRTAIPASAMPREYDDTSCRFTINIIPHTWQVTTLGERKAGDLLNLEIDLIARYVERLMMRKN